MLDHETLSLQSDREKEIHLAGCRAGLEYAQRRPDRVERGLEVVDMEVSMLNWPKIL